MLSHVFAGRLVQDTMHSVRPLLALAVLRGTLRMQPALVLLVQPRMATLLRITCTARTEGFHLMAQQQGGLRPQIMLHMQRTARKRQLGLTVHKGMVTSSPCINDCTAYCGNNIQNNHKSARVHELPHTIAGPQAPSY